MTDVNDLRLSIRGSLRLVGRCCLYDELLTRLFALHLQRNRLHLGWSQLELKTKRNMSMATPQKNISLSTCLMIPHQLKSNTLTRTSA